MLILSIVASAIAGVYIHEKGLLNQAAHRMQSMNYARACADSLLALCGRFQISRCWTNLPTELNDGMHDARTDPELCVLPESYFRDTMKGELKYEVKKYETNRTKWSANGIVRGKIIVEWTENFPKEEKKTQELSVILGSYDEYF